MPVETLALTLIGTGHTLAAGRDGAQPDAVQKVVTAVPAGAVRDTRQ
jgi:hypothetical protein